ncbi:MAG: molybdate ABC transporter substrate-binding protein [Paracoccaceae bacterium]|nr:molybdate ABC transporter substrate-binding protein [Paracoccaceae bacterium]
MRGLAVLLILCALPGRAEPVTVFAAASLKPVLDSVLADWPGETVSVYGGSSALARQIEAGAPADIFISANADWMDHLVAGGAVPADSTLIIARNRLVLVAAAGAPPVGIDALAALAGARIAVALTDAVPAGVYAKAALTRFGVWEALRPTLVETQDVRAALRLAVTGAAPYAIVYASDAVGAAGVDVAVVFPENSHPPIVYLAGPTTDAGPGAAAVLAHIAASGDAFAAAGFLPPEGE